MKNNKQKKSAVFLDVIVVLLFFCGLALIAAGLWQWWKPAALMFLGISSLYVAYCMNNAAKPHERTDKK